MTGVGWNACLRRADGVVAEKADARPSRAGTDATDVYYGRAVGSRSRIQLGTVNVIAFVKDIDVVRREALTSGKTGHNDNGCYSNVNIEYVRSVLELMCLSVCVAHQSADWRMSHRKKL